MGVAIGLLQTVSVPFDQNQCARARSPARRSGRPDRASGRRKD